MTALNLPRPAWMTEDLVLLEEQARRLGTTLVRDFFLVIERYLSVRKWADLGAFLADLPKAACCAPRCRKNMAAAAAPSRMRR